MNLRYMRVHSTGAAELFQHSDGWRVQIDLSEAIHAPVTIVGYLQPCLETAKQLADAELLKRGHVCSAACKAWKACETSQEPRQLILATPDA